MLRGSVKYIQGMIVTSNASCTFPFLSFSCPFLHHFIFKMNNIYCKCAYSLLYCDPIAGMTSMLCHIIGTMKQGIHVH